MSKNEPNTITTPGASAPRSRSTQKVLDIQRRFIDASKVRNSCWIRSVPLRGSVGSRVTESKFLRNMVCARPDPTLPRCGTDRMQVGLSTFRAKPLPGPTSLLLLTPRVSTLQFLVQAVRMILSILILARAAPHFIPKMNCMSSFVE